MDIYPDERRIRSAPQRNGSSWLGLKGGLVVVALALLGLFVYFMDDMNIFLSGDAVPGKTAALQLPPTEETHLTPVEKTAQNPQEFTEPVINPIDQHKPVVPMEQTLADHTKSAHSRIERHKADLSKTDLSKTDLSKTDLSKTDLTAATKNETDEVTAEIDNGEPVAQPKKLAEKPAEKHPERLAEKSGHTIAKNITTAALPEKHKPVTAQKIVAASKETSIASNDLSSSASKAPKKELINTPKQADVITATATPKPKENLAKENLPKENQKVATGNYVLQLIGSSDKQKLQSFVLAHKLAGKVVIAHSKRAGHDWYTLLYGNYTDRDQAVQAAKKLAATVHDVQPWPRKLAAADQILKD